MYVSLLTNQSAIEKTSEILVPTGVTNIFLTSERGKPLYSSKKWPKVPGPKVSVIERFHCICHVCERVLNCICVCLCICHHLWVHVYMCVHVCPCVCR